MAGSKKGLFHEWAQRVMRALPNRVNPNENEENGPILPLYVIQAAEHLKLEQGYNVDGEVLNARDTQDSVLEPIQRTDSVKTVSNDGSVTDRSIEHGESVDSGASFWKGSEDGRGNFLEENRTICLGSEFVENCLDVDMIGDEVESEKWHDCDKKLAKKFGVTEEIGAVGEGKNSKPDMGEPEKESKLQDCNEHDGESEIVPPINQVLIVDHVDGVVADDELHQSRHPLDDLDDDDHKTFMPRLQNYGK